MTVLDIIRQFTHTNFTLIVLDVVDAAEYYNGAANEVEDDPSANFYVVAMEPPVRANEVILYVDTDNFLDSDEESILVTDY